MSVRVFLPLIKPKDADLILYVFPEPDKTGIIKVYSEDSVVVNELKVRGETLLTFDMKSVWPEAKPTQLRAVVGFLEALNVAVSVQVIQENNAIQIRPFKNLAPSAYMFPSIYSDTICILNESDIPTKVTLDLKNKQVTLMARPGLSVFPCRFIEHDYRRFIFSGRVMVSELWLGYD